MTSMFRGTIVVLIAIALAGIAVSRSPQSPTHLVGISAAMADEDSCSLVSLRGTYAVHAQGTIVGQLPAPFPAPPFPLGEAGIVTFDGNGNHSGKTTVNIDGVVLTPTFNGTYTINSDCTGTITVNSSAGFTLHG